MICQFERLIYPKNVAVDPSSYMIAVYRTCEKIQDSVGNDVSQIKAVGYCLPTAENLRFQLNGHWSKNPKHGVQFEVESYDEMISPTKEGIIAYLASGQIKGIGPQIAEKIFEKFGVQALEVLDKEPKKLLVIPGISQNKLQKICESYLANRGARDVVAFLTPHITPNRAVQFYQIYGDETMDVVKKHPYKLCEVPGIGFHTADKIAMSMGFQKLTPERVDEGLVYTLQEAESKGNLCLEKHSFIKKALKILATPELTEEMAANRAARLVHSGRLTCYGDSVYRPEVAEAEEQLAKMIYRKSKQRVQFVCENIEQTLDLEEKKLGIRLDADQRNAVLTALQSSISIITGGPGTGKTSIQKAILDIYRSQCPGNQIVCCAPTGRAARRMEQSTGFTASTVHKALSLFAGEDGTYREPEPLEADLILVDEVSMLDIYLAKHIMQGIPNRCQVIFVGDSDQLPSVGPGAVLSEIIKCGIIPVVRLDKIYRQREGSRIASNAKLIRHGNLSLDYGDDFRFVKSNALTQSAEILEHIYMKETAKYGIDNVALLSPYRKKTETGINALNERIRLQINPPAVSKKEVTFGKRTLRIGDKIMQIKNREDINNGDVGYIMGISGNGSETVVKIDFGDGRMAQYDITELGMLDLGYASTIHKSQGAEYQSVIINLQCMHSTMLIRPLIYTAITRAKERVIIVGERRALCTAIKKQDAETRGTMLAQRLIELSGRT